jgi:hypothetical protein
LLVECGYLFFYLFGAGCVALRALSLQSRSCRCENHEGENYETVQEFSPSRCYNLGNTI